MPSLLRSPGALFGAGAALLALQGCAQVLGLQDWEDPERAAATSSSGASSGAGGSVGAGGTGGAGGAGTSSGSGASSTSGASTSSVVTSTSASSGVASGAGGDISCADGIQNFDESDVDCGGSCVLCGYEKTCGNDGDCSSGNCQLGRCEIPYTGCQDVGLDPTCADCTKNGDETDVDCGGVCSPCGFGKSCTNHGECWSASCASGHCAVGGKGQPCTGAQDCASAQCAPGNCVQLGFCCL